MIPTLQDPHSLFSTCVRILYKETEKTLTLLILTTRIAPEKGAKEFLGGALLRRARHIE